MNDLLKNAAGKMTRKMTRNTSENTGEFMRAAFTILILTGLIGLAAGCSHDEKKPDSEKAPPAASAPISEKSPSAGSSIEAKQVAAEEQTRFVAEFQFAKGKAKLSAGDRRRLDELLKKAGASGAIDKVIAIAWADEEYPSVHSKKLSNGQVRLAKQRGESLQKDVVAQNKDLKVKTYNMAERPGMIAETFKSEDARIKKSLEVAGIPNTDTSVKQPSKASRAMVLVLLRE